MMKHFFPLLMAACVSLALSAHANAQGTFTDGGADSNWSTAANWDDGMVPGAGVNVIVGVGAFSGVTADYDLPSSTIADLRVGASAGSGTLNMSSGSLTSTGWAFVGADNTAADTATFNLSGNAAFDTTQRFYTGIGGGSSTATLNVSDSASLVGAQNIFGANAGNTGVVNQSGGSVASNDWTTIGEASGAQSTYNLSGGTFTAGSDLTIGQADAGTTGTFNLSGGSATVNVAMFVGRGEFGGGGATGNLNIDGSAGTFSANGDVHFGGHSFAAQDATGNLGFTADAAGVSTLDIAGSLFLNDGTTVGGSGLSVDLTADSDFASFGATGTPMEILLVNNINNSVTGTFAGLAEGATISIGGGKTGTLSYVGGDGNDISVTVLAAAIPEPSSVLLASLGLMGLVARRRRS